MEKAEFKAIVHDFVAKRTAEYLHNRGSAAPSFAFPAIDVDDPSTIHKVMIEPWGCSKDDITYDVWVETTGHCSMFQTMDALVDWLSNASQNIKEQLLEDKRWVDEETPKLQAYFHEHFEGKTWDEIDDDMWGYYSDWHKDVFGYRPHGIVCGVYINPHQM